MGNLYNLCYVPVEEEKKGYVENGVQVGEMGGDDMSECSEESSYI